VLAFLVIGAAGILLLLLSLVVGDLLDGLLDFGGDLFSGAALAGFLGAFGFGGAIAYDVDGNLTVAMLVGLAAGLVVGAGAGWVSLQLKKGGDESNVRTGDLTGQDAVVVSAIPDDGFGEVSIVVAGHITKLNARSSTARPAGTPVIITTILSATSVLVEPRS
jgi:membrane protein implicated in regulation of membrane protease activity